MDFEEQDRTQPEEDLFDLDMPVERPKKKKKKTGLIIGIVAALVAVAATIGILFALGVFEKKEEAPKEVTAEELHTAMLGMYQERLYALSDQLPAAVNGYSALINMGSTSASGAQMDLHLLLGEPLLERLETSLAQSGMEMDLSWLKDISLNYDMSSDNATAQYFLTLGLGDKAVATLDAVLDAENMALYLGVPELTPYYMLIQLVDPELFEAGAVTSMIQGQQGVMQELATSLASIDGLDSSMKAYVDLVLAALKDPAIGEETITLEGVSQTFTTVTYQLTEEQLIDLAEALLQQAKTDEALKQLIVAFGNYSNDMMAGSDSSYEPVDLYQEFQDALDEALDQLSSTEPEAGNYMELCSYIDDQWMVQGSKLTIYSTEESVPATLRWIAVANGDEQLVECVIEDEEDTHLTITGTQSRKDGLYNGSFKIAFPEKRTLDVELTDIKNQDGELSGSIQITPSITLMQEILGDSYASIRLLMGGKVGLRLDFSDDNQFGLHITGDGESVIGLTLDIEFTESKGVTLPEESAVLTGEDGYYEWLATLDPEALLEKLEQAGVPVEQLEDLLTAEEAA